MEEVSLPLAEVRTRLLEVCLGVREHGIVTGLCTTVCDVCTTNNVCTQAVSGYSYPRVEIFVV